jgi:hypothetical protein
VRERQSDGARDTSGKVARDGILPGESTNIPGLAQIDLLVFLTTESFCSAVGQHCQSQVVRMLSKSNYAKR